MFGGACAIVSLCLLAAPCRLSAEPADLILVVGAAGEPQYGEMFQQAAERWQEWAADQSLRYQWIGPNESEPSNRSSNSSESEASAEPDEQADQKLETTRTDRDLLKQTLTDSLSPTKSKPSRQRPLWIVLMGHGTFRAAEARFNLEGPDVSATEFNAWCANTERPLVVINGASASGPFIPALSGDNRIIVTATRDGEEDNFARFFDAMSKTLQSETADLDHDDAISMLEAFVAANQQVQEYYRVEDRIATEHALIDDNGDGLGTPAKNMESTLHSGEPANSKWDGRLATKRILTDFGQHAALSDEQREQRDEWEAKLAALRSKKAKLSEDDYLEQLEQILVPLARLYADAESTADP